MATPSFHSLSQGKFLQKLQETMVDSKTNKMFTVIERYPVTFLYQKVITRTDAVAGEKIYYPNDWHYFKAYIPAGAIVDIQMTTYPNTALRLHAKFKGDQNNIFDHTNPIFTGFGREFYDKILSNKQYTIDAIVTNNANLHFYNLPIGGWIYFSLVGDVSGYYENPPGSASVNFTYTIKIVDKDLFYNHLKSLQYNAPDGDPVDAIEYLVVKNPVAPNKINEYKIFLDRPNQTYNYSPNNTSSNTDPNNNQISESSSVASGGSMSNTSSSSANDSRPIKPPVPSLNTNSPDDAENKNVNISSIEDLINFFNGKEQPIKGYFVYYGKEENKTELDKWKWLYVSAQTGQVFKLAGWDETNRKIKWEKLFNKNICLKGKVKEKRIIFYKDVCRNSKNVQLDTQSSRQSSSSVVSYMQESSSPNKNISSIQGGGGMIFNGLIK